MKVCDSLMFSLITVSLLLINTFLVNFLPLLNLKLTKKWLNINVGVMPWQLSCKLLKPITLGSWCLYHHPRLPLDASGFIELNIKALTKKNDEQTRNTISHVLEVAFTVDPKCIKNWDELNSWSMPYGIYQINII